MARQALYILVRAIADMWDNLLVMVVANILWSISLMPGLTLLLFVPGLLGLIPGLILLIVLVGPATLGLFGLTVEINRLERVEFSEYWRNIRQHYRRGWVLGLLNFIFFVLAFFNLAFYLNPSISNSPLGLGLIFWGYMAFFWFTMQIYLWPLAIRMEKLQPANLLRNAFLASFKYPVLSLLLSLFLGLFFFVSSLLAFLPLIFFGMSYYAVVCNKALAVVLAREKDRAVRLSQEGKSQAFQVEAPPLPTRTPAEEDGFYSTRNAPPGVLKRGLDSWPEEDPRPPRSARR